MSLLELSNLDMREGIAAFAIVPRRAECTSSFKVALCDVTAPSHLS